MSNERIVRWNDIEENEVQAIVLSPMLQQAMSEEIWNFMEEYNRSQYLNRILIQMMLRAESDIVTLRNGRKTQYREVLRRAVADGWLDLESSGDGSRSVDARVEEIAERLAATNYEGLISRRGGHRRREQRGNERRTLRKSTMQERFRNLADEMGVELTPKQREQIATMQERFRLLAGEMGITLTPEQEEQLRARQQQMEILARETRVELTPMQLEQLDAMKDADNGERIRGEPYQLRLNKAAQAILACKRENYLQKDVWGHYAGYRGRKAYLEAMLEDYASRPRDVREEIFFQEVMDTIRQVLAEPQERRHAVVITVRVPTEKVIDKNYTDGRGGRMSKREMQTSDTEQYTIVPYALEVDEHVGSYYLAGMYRKDPKKRRLSPKSVRISRITDVTICTDDQEVCGISGRQGRALDERIRRMGIAYAARENEKESADGIVADEIVVYLTAEGLRKYRSILFNRPAYISIVEDPVDTLEERLVPSMSDEEREAARQMWGRDQAEMEEPGATLTFDCSVFMAEIYFRRFGADAVVIKPEGLRERLLALYTSGLACYSKEHVDQDGADL